MSVSYNLSTIKPQDLYQLKLCRWKARTDLGWLCREILNYPDVSDSNGGPWHGLHQPIIDILQHFPKPTAEQFDNNDKLVSGKWQYKSLLPLLKLPGNRWMLSLDPLGFLKTSINVVSHVIQWIINNPDI